MPDESSRLRAAARCLAEGGLVAFPTETVYGLGAHAFDEAAVRRVFTVKGRPVDNPLIVHVAAIDAVTRVAAEMSPLARRLADDHWPGPLTLVLPARADLPAVTTGGLDTVAVRIPAHPLALALLQHADLPVAAPSANRSGRPSPTTAADVRAELGEGVDLILDGGSSDVGLESTVVDVRGTAPVILREGAVTREELGVAAARTTRAQARRSPGTRYRHYAPTCEIVVAPVGRGDVAAREQAATGRQVGLVGTGAAPDGVVEIARFADATELARILYRSLRLAEDAAVEVLVVEAVPDTGIGRAVMDRLRRAADAGHRL